jgi:hypothetical protein
MEGKIMKRSVDADAVKRKKDQAFFSTLTATDTVGFTEDVQHTGLFSGAVMAR